MRKFFVLIFCLVSQPALAREYEREICRGRLADGRVLRFDSYKYPVPNGWNVVMSIDVDSFPNNELEAYGTYVDAGDTSIHDGNQATIARSNKGPITAQAVHDSCYSGMEGSYSETIQIQTLDDSSTMRLNLSAGLSLAVICEFYSVKGQGDCGKDN